MALRFVYTNPVTGEVSARAHLVLDDPIIRGDVQHVIVRGRVYASKDDYDAGKQQINSVDKEYGQAEYDELRAANMEICEAWVLRDFPDLKPMPPGQGGGPKADPLLAVSRVSD